MRHSRIHRKPGHGSSIDLALDELAADNRTHLAQSMPRRFLNIVGGC